MFSRNAWLLYCSIVPMTSKAAMTLMDLLPFVVGSSIVLLALVGVRELLKEIGMAMNSADGH